MTTAVLPLPAEQVRAFFERGFVVVPDVFTPAEIDAMRSAFDRLQDTASRLSEPTMVRGSQFVVERVHEGAIERVRIDRVVWCGAAEPALSAFGRDLRIVRMAAQLLGASEMSQIINQAHFKLPGDGVEFPWHQDSTHRRYGGSEWRDLNGRGSYVQAAIAVDDVTAENGPIEFLPGSCSRGHLDLPPDGKLPGDIDPSRAEFPTMRAGSVLLFGPYTIHRSLPNRSSRPRRVFINGFAYPGANSRVYPGEGAGRTVRVDARAAAQ